MRRRRFLQNSVLGAGGAHAALSGLLAAPTAWANDGNFSWEALVDQAASDAKRPYRDNRTPIPDYWKSISFDQYRQINYDGEQAVWRGEGDFEIQLFHLGLYFDRAVKVNEIVEGHAQPLHYAPDMFTFSRFEPDVPMPDIGFSGFRVHYPLNTPAYHDEFAVFQGASYFRLVGRGHGYGQSARGLAIDTASQKGEEFPYFSEFWLEKPSPTDTALRVYARLDSPSCTGAFRFVVRPRTESQIDVRARIFPRRPIDKLGIAPLTSMFLFGENSERRFDDFRPEVHDTDGLMVHAGTGEWIWRPLADRKELTVSSYAGGQPRGFGLVQRDRDFARYQDLEARYHERPSMWIQPVGEWGDGRVELVEIPSDSEINDNIVSYWVPARQVQAGDDLEFAYILNAFSDKTNWPPGGRVEATRIGTAARPGSTEKIAPDARLFVIDFNGGDLPHLAADQPVEAIASASVGYIKPSICQKNPQTGGWRAFFDYFPDGAKSADLRCYLRMRQHALSETWSYLWTA